MTRPAKREFDSRALLGFAHPLRVRMFDELAARGPATATELARRLGESTGATSYHLRLLARHGFIEEDPDRGSARERWWRAAPGPLKLVGDESLHSTDPSVRQAVRLVLSEWNRARHERLVHWLSAQDAWTREWQEAALDDTTHLKLRAEELAELGQELRGVLWRWKDRCRDRDVEGTTDVEIQVNAFPLEPVDHPNRPAPRERSREEETR